MTRMALGGQREWRVFTGGRGGFPVAGGKIAGSVCVSASYVMRWRLTGGEGHQGKKVKSTISPYLADGSLT